MGYCLKSVVVIAVLFAVGRGAAQDMQWVPQRVVFQVPTQAWADSWSDCSGTHLDTVTSVTTTDSFDVVLPLDQTTYETIGDSVSVMWQFDNGDSTVSYAVGFRPDTSTHQFRTLHFEYHKLITTAHSQSGPVYRMNLDGLGYAMTSADQGVIELDAEPCMDALLTYARQDRTTIDCTDPVTPGSQYGRSLTTKSIGSDAALFHFRLEFQITGGTDAALRPRALGSQTQRIGVQYGIGYTDLTFATSDRSRTLVIYDIIGREVLREQIPFGADHLRVATSTVRSGTYFARIAEQTTSFVLP